MTDLKKTLAYLPENKIHDLEVITQRIIATGKAEMVILFGSYARGTYSEVDGKIRGRKSDYDVLVVTRDKETAGKIQPLIENQFEDIDVIVNLEIHSINFVNSNLEDAQYFFLDVKREGKILYDNHRFELSDPKEITPQKRRETAEEDFKEWFDTARINFRNAEMNKEESIKTNNSKYLQKASFEIQQAAEMCYATVEMVFRHYRTREHKLSVLRNKIKKYDNRVDIPFPLETVEQQVFFVHLDYAYIGGRYKSEKEYPVTQKQLDYWSTETKKLLKLTEQICKEKVEQLKEIEKAAG